MILTVSQAAEHIVPSPPLTLEYITGASLKKETGKKILKTVRFRADGTTLSDCHVLTEAKDSEGKIARRNVYFAATVPTGAPAGSVTWSAGLPSVSLPTIYTEAGATAESTDLTNGALYFAKFEVPVIQSVIEVGNDSFPGTYYITGDTYARNETTGEDEFFQFVVPKAKMQAENTITLEAEGDPSVFNFNMKVLRPEDGVMMKLIQYNFNLGNSDEDEG